MSAGRHRVRQRGRRSRRLLAWAGAGGVLLLAGTAVTQAAFTSRVAADLGTVGGSYAIAFLAEDGSLVPGDPEPMLVQEVVPGPEGSTAVEVRVVTTTAATGPVVLTLHNARASALPPDAGIGGTTGADPYDVALFSVSVDGQVLASRVTAADWEPVVIGDWQTGTPRTVQVAVHLPAALGNPYYSGRAMVLGLQFDGSTS